MLNRTIKQLHNDLRNKQISVKEVIQQCNDRAKQIQSLNAFVTMNPERDSQAQISDDHFAKGTPRGVLEGIPVAVKDNFCVSGLPTSCASLMLKDFRPRYTASVVSRLLDGGAVLLGKTNLDEFAMGSGSVDSLWGRTENPWGRDRIAGGSSGGSAVAVASGVCLAALGSDTGGSTRNPASYCGVVGLKPSYGLLSRHGLIPLVNSMDVVGVLTQNVEDAATILELLAGHDPKDSTTLHRRARRARGSRDSEPSVRGLKVGIPREFHREGLSEEMADVWEDAAALLEEGGAKVVPISMSHTEHSIVCYSVLNQCEVASNMARYDGLQFGHRSSNTESTHHMFAEGRGRGLGGVVRSRVLAGNYFLLNSNYDRYFTQALKVRRLIAEDFREAWRQGCHLLLTPTTLSEAPLCSDFTSKDQREQCAVQDYCTQPANLAGVPAVSLPFKLSSEGLPLSLQLMAPFLQDHAMLQAARYIESTVGFEKHRTRLFSSGS